jgi:hypothetical protein
MPKYSIIKIRVPKNIYVFAQHFIILAEFMSVVCIIKIISFYIYKFIKKD